MASETIAYRREGAIGILTLDRPEKLNAMTHAMGDAIRALVPELNADPGLRVLVVRGEGRAFSAGGDLSFLEENSRRTRSENEDVMVDFYTKFLELQEVEVPTIAAVHGRATGAGLCFALGCDLRVAAEDALLSFNFVRVGLSPGMGGTWNLPRLVGPAVAAELMFTGRTVNAAEALALGLINRVVPGEALMEAAMALAQEIAAGSPVAMRETKALLKASGMRTIAEQLDSEAAAQATCFASEDLREGIQAIREKRTPRFEGR